jgi:hypothetical protein
MKQRKIRIAAVMLLGALPLAALAASVPQQSAPAATASGPSDPATRNQAESPMFKQLDTNKDGYISKAEAARSANLSAKFAKLDTNHDGRISVQEYDKGGMS